ncbi:MAG: acyltransferase family protein [Nocardioidaceae bacterium]
MTTPTTQARQITERPAAVTPSDPDRGGRPPEGAPRRGRARELEGYRGLAALTIIGFHVFQYAQQAGGVFNPVVDALARFETVDILFLMSAYLLTLSYARAAIDGEEPQTARQFLFRRAVRILPLYWIGVTTVWALRNPALPGDWVDLLEHLTFTQVFDRNRIFFTLGPVWSMSLEVTFYGVLVLLGGLAVRAGRRVESRRRRVALLLAGVSVLIAVPFVWNTVAFVVLHVPFDDWPVYFGPQARFGAFGAGMLLAVIVAARRGRPVFGGVWPSVLRLLGLAVVAAASWISRPDSWGQVVFHDLAEVGWFLLLASTVLGRPGQLWSRVLSWRVLTWVGLVSYSAYMWHEPLMMLLDHLGLLSRSAAALPVSAALVLAVALAAGWLSFHVIEKPTSKLRMLRDRHGRRREYYPELTGDG